MKRFPSGIIEIVDDPSGINWHSGAKIEIWNLEDLFEPLGLSSNSRADWLNKYGVSDSDSLGVPIIPQFPEFSKAAWMHIDSVRFNRENLPALLEECGRAEAFSVSVMAQAAFRNIGKLVEEAIKKDAEIEFGHP